MMEEAQNPSHSFDGQDDIIARDKNVCFCSNDSNYLDAKHSASLEVYIVKKEWAEFG